MKEKDESDCSRRTFVKNLSATAIALMSNVGNARPMETEAAGTASASDATWLSLNEASRLVRDKKISPVELAQGCLNRIDRLNPRLNAFITVTAESALAQAREAETEIQHRWGGRDFTYQTPLLRANVKASHRWGQAGTIDHALSRNGSGQHEK